MDLGLQEAESSPGRLHAHPMVRDETGWWHTVEGQANGCFVLSEGGAEYVTVATATETHLVLTNPVAARHRLQVILRGVATVSVG